MLDSEASAFRGLRVILAQKRMLDAWDPFNDRCPDLPAWKIRIGEDDDATCRLRMGDQLQRFFVDC